MNIDALKMKMEAYFKSTTPEQVLAEFEAMGVEFDDIINVELTEFQSEIIPSSMISFNDGYHFWQDKLIVKPSIKLNNLSDNYQYAMAA